MILLSSVECFKMLQALFQFVWRKQFAFYFGMMQWLVVVG